MLQVNTIQRLPENLKSYWDLKIAIVALLSLPLNIFFFFPIIILAVVFFILRAEYHNFTFIYDEHQITLNTGIFTKAQNSIPYDTVQNINIVSGILMRKFCLVRVEIWTSSPAQIQVFQDRERGYRTEHRPEGALWLSRADAEDLKKFILDHKILRVQKTKINETK